MLSALGKFLSGVLAFILQKETVTEMPQKQDIVLIAAAGEENELGLNGDLPWHLPNDFKRFKTLTMGHPMIMGRKTFDTFPKPLPGREHIIVTRDTSYAADFPNCTVVHSLEDAIAAAGNAQKIFIIGGGEIYRQGLPFATGVELTRVHGKFPADTHFPVLEPSQWECIASDLQAVDERHAFAFTYETYRRK